MENGPLVLSANSCNPRDDRALSKNVFPLFALSNRESHTSRFPASLPFNGHKRVSGTDSHIQLDRSRDSARVEVLSTT